MNFTGTLHKMLTEYQEPIRYYLNLNESYIELNQLIGRNIYIEHIGNECCNCKLNKPIFRMGFCKECFFTSPYASPSIIKPELSQAHLGKEVRDLSWEQKFELQPHVVYLAISGGVKVGVTRGSQIPTRWIDQGAKEAIVLAETENRYQAGVIEVALKEHFSDKTSWQRMLKNENPDEDLLKVKELAKSYLNKEQADMVSDDNKIWKIEYPLESFPTNVKSINLDRVKSFSIQLSGIKGQYLISTSQEVFNVRRHEGYKIQLKIS